MPPTTNAPRLEFLHLSLSHPEKQSGYSQVVLIQTMEHVITAEDSDDFEIKTTWLDWAMTLAQLFDLKDTE